MIEIFKDDEFRPTYLNDIIDLEINDEAAWNEFGITSRLLKRKI